MKKIVLVFIFLCLFSCSAGFQDIQQGGGEVSIEENFQQENVNSGYDLGNTKQLVKIYKEEPELVQQIISDELKVGDDSKKYFLDGLVACEKIRNSNFSNINQKEDFLKDVELYSLYKNISDGKISGYDLCLEDGRIKQKCSFEQSDLLLASYFAGRTSLDDTKKYLLELSHFYKDKEFANSVLLKVMHDKLSNLSLDGEYCEEKFLKEYEGEL